MKASLAIVLASSLLAAASPIKRDIKTEWVTDITYVTVTAEPPVFKPKHTQTHSKKVSVTKAPAPSPTSTTPVVVTVVVTPTPVPTTTTPPTTPPTTSPTTTAAPSPTTAAAVAAAAPEEPAVDTTTAAAPATTTAAAATTTKAAAAAAPTDFASTAVYHHNLHRSNHSAPAMSWNSDLASYAATVAAKCVFAHDLTPGSDTGSYGQNIAMYGGSGDVESKGASKTIAEAITDMWYNGEVWQFPDSNYGSSDPDMTNFESWGHFSQLVWVDSTEVGCAAQYCAPGTMYSDMGAWFSVCNYRSAGNMGGAYGTNVLRPLGQGTVSA